MEQAKRSPAVPRLDWAEPRFCKDCRWCHPSAPALLVRLGLSGGRALRLARCMHPSATKLAFGTGNDFLVAGKTTIRDPDTQHLCCLERNDNREGHCGLLARFWTPRDSGTPTGNT